MPSPDTVILSQKVLVRGLRLDAFIGIHDHERDRTQFLLVDVEVLSSAQMADLMAEQDVVLSF